METPVDSSDDRSNAPGQIRAIHYAEKCIHSRPFGGALPRRTAREFHRVFSVACDRSPRTPTRFSARTLLLMTDPAYPLPHRLTVDDLDPETATTDALIAMVRRHRESEKYPTPEQLLRNLPVARRALCDHVLTGQTSALDVAYRLASIIDALEGGNKLPEPAHRTH